MTFKNLEQLFLLKLISMDLKNEFRVFTIVNPLS